MQRTTSYAWPVSDHSSAPQSSSDSADRNVEPDHIVEPDYGIATSQFLVSTQHQSHSLAGSECLARTKQLRGSEWSTDDLVGPDFWSDSLVGSEHIIGSHD